MFQIFTFLAAVIHIYIFVLESLLWGRPKINRVFGVTSQEAENLQLFAFNQGFYNLFLAVAAFLGIVLSAGSPSVVGETLMIYANCSMLGAALVLLYSSPKLIRAVLIQGAPPLLALVFCLLV